MQIAIYCPDTHILYDGDLPDRVGVGGGVTARIRIAAALARKGHTVSVIGNCPRESVHGGVRYTPLKDTPRIDCEVLVMHSSSGIPDLSPLLAVEIHADLRVLFLSGVPLPAASDQLRPDTFYACSNFIRNEVLGAGVPGEKLFVSYHGVNSWNKRSLIGPLRDRRRLIYSSHPFKGLAAAVELTRRLREHDNRFRLHCFGGQRLCGRPEEAPPPDDALVYGGLLNQRQLAAEYKRSGFAMQLQTRPEPFGITVIEAMAAGCIVVGSPVGSLPELIRHGETGFLIEGDPSHPDTINRATDLIRTLSRDGSLMRKIGRQAAEAVLDWDQVAEVWGAHFEWLLGRNKPQRASCPECHAPSLILADGSHCTSCGLFIKDRSLAVMTNFAPK